jgi:hypothetical protein
MSHPARDDPAMISAIAVIAMIIATFAHEAVGHGSACLTAGGQITQLTSVYFDCSAMTGLVALAGPAGNLAAALLGWLALCLLAQAAIRARLLALLVMALSAFWAAGYLIYAMLKRHGDYALAAHELLGLPSQVWRPAGVLLGLVFYWVSARLVARGARDIVGARAGPALRTAWAAAGIGAVLAAALYRPDPGGAMVQATLEISAASIPLLFLVRRNAAGPAAPLITRSIGWIAAAMILFAAFAVTLGRGIA